MTSVIAQRVRLQADARLIEDGARGGLAIAVFPIRMLELRAGAALAHGRFGVDGGVHDRGSGSLGSTYWFAQRFGASVDYEVSVVDDSLFVLGNAMSVRMIGRY